MAQNIDSSNIEHDEIIINIDNVTIDGLGRSLTGPVGRNTNARGIIAYDRSGVIIKNIKITGFNTSILFAHTKNMINEKGFSSTNKSNGITISNVQASDPKFQGFHINADNFRITGSSVYGVGPGSEKSHSFATGIYVVGNLCEVSNNQILLGRPTGSGENLGIAIYYGNGCRVTENRIAFDSWPEYGENFGIWVIGDAGSLPVFENNLITSASYALGPYGVSRNNIGINTSCSIFVTRKSTVSRLVDLGGNSNIARESERDPAIGIALYKNNPEEMKKSYQSSPSIFTAFSVSRAYQEDPRGVDVKKVLA